VKTIAFFNNKGGVGKTTLVYHLAWMFNEMGIDVVALDLDPQANLTSAFFDESRQLDLWWPADNRSDSIFKAVEPLLEHLGDIQPAKLAWIANHLHLLPGDLALSRFEDRLAEAWPKCLTGDADSFRVTTAFYRLAAQAAQERRASIALFDVGPSLGALTRAALIASDFVVVPLGADLFSLQGLMNLGPTLRKWRQDWLKRINEAPGSVSPLPTGDMRPVGYVVLQHAVRADRPVFAYQRWDEQIPPTYAEQLLDEPRQPGNHCLARIKHYRSLMPLAQEVRKPMFLLKPADGAIGGHAQAVEQCYADFKALAERLLEVCGLERD
jgi:cellulose biosynthesis protein BcsQ